MISGDVAPYLTAGAGIGAAYVAFRNQQRLKAFELFYSRREAVFKDLEAELFKIYALQASLRNGTLDSAQFDNYRLFFDGFIIFQKVKGARFGEAADQLAGAYYTMLNEIFQNPNKVDLVDWLDRCRNVLSALYGASHRQISDEIESLTVPMPTRWVRAARERLKSARRKRSAQRELKPPSEQQ